MDFVPLTKNYNIIPFPISISFFFIKRPNHPTNPHPTPTPHPHPHSHKQQWPMLRMVMWWGAGNKRTQIGHNFAYVFTVSQSIFQNRTALIMNAVIKGYEQIIPCEMHIVVLFINKIPEIIPYFQLLFVKTGEKMTSKFGCCASMFMLARTPKTSHAHLRLCIW